MTYHVYILFSVTLNKYYVGYTSDLNERVYKHNIKHKGFTGQANDWELKYSESFNTKEEATNREREIKRKKSRAYLEYLVQKED